VNHVSVEAHLNSLLLAQPPLLLSPPRRVVHPFTLTTPPSQTFMETLRVHPFYAGIIVSPQLPENPGSLLSEAILQNALAISYDGSHKTGQQFSSYGFACASHGTPLFGFPGPSPGHCSQLSPIRAEICSLVVTLHLLSMTRNYYNVSGGSVQMYNNCLKVVKLINNPGQKFKRLLVDDYDLLNEARHLLASLQRSISVTIQWVKGHYKGSKREIQHILNEEAHHLAHAYEHPSLVVPLDIAPPSSLITLHRDFSITSRWKAFINTEAHKKALKATICINAS